MAKPTRGESEFDPGEKPDFAEQAVRLVEKVGRREAIESALRLFFKQAHPAMKKDQRLAFEALVRSDKTTLPLTHEKLVALATTILQPEKRTESQAELNVASSQKTFEGRTIYDAKEGPDSDPDPHGDGHYRPKK